MSAHNPILRAADPAHSAWVSANAGAGKTHTLANRVTRLLLADTPPERILCLTYTKAAAAEMADRLFNVLGRWAMASDDELENFITDIEGRAPASKHELAKARRLFAKALETPGGLKILTIHSFCQNVLSRFPIEAGVPPGFSVIDEQTSRELIANARAKVLERAGSGDIALAAAVGLLVTESSEQKLNDILDSTLGNDRRKLARILGHSSPFDGSLTRAIRKFHRAEEKDNEHEIVSKFCASLKSEMQQLTDAVMWMNAGGARDKERAAGIERFLSTHLSVNAYPELLSSFFSKKGEPYASVVSKKIASARPDLQEYLDGLAQRVYQTEESRRAAHAAALCEAAITIADAVRELYAKEKRNRGALDYDDLITRTLALLDRSDASAWVLYKLDGGIDHILVDEAQDTSPEQWAILKKLTEEFFSGEGREMRATVRTVFAVGDEKQSIFSFQGADPIQFDVSRRHFESRIREAGLTFNFERLQTSRRSVPEVLAFVDRVFSDSQTRAGLVSPDTPIEHIALRQDTCGKVEFWPAVKPDDADEPDPWRPVDAPSQASPSVRLAEKLAHTIKMWIANGYALPGKQKPIEPQDIMILLPRREPFGSEIIRQLKSLGVPVAGADRIRITEQIAVMDLIALGRFVLLPEDDLNLAAVLRSPLCGISEEQLFQLSHKRNGTLWRALLENASDELAPCRQFLSDCLSIADYLPPYEFYAHVLSVCGMRTRLLTRLGADAADAIEEFHSLALIYEQQNPPSLEGFLHWVERGGTEIKRDMERGRNEVRVMTVHGAKGLEADIVILPDTTRQASNLQKRHLLFANDGVLYSVPNESAPEAVKAAKKLAADEALAEHKRLLYVALTRARERLYICGFENKKGVDPNSWYALMERAATELGIPVERDGETIRVFGDGPDLIPAESPLPERLEVEIPPWVFTPAEDETERPRIVRPSLAEPKAKTLSPLSKESQTFQRGLLIHAALARLPDIEPSRRPDAVRAFLRARGLTKNDADLLSAEILAVLADETFAPAFDKNSRAEVALAADLAINGGIRVTGRVDRLSVSGDEVLVLDFKTDRAAPARVADVPDAYLLQMALYREALRKIFPGKKVKVGLLWTVEPRLMNLADRVLDAQLARLGDLDPPKGHS